MKKFLINSGIISIPLVVYLIIIALIDPFNYLNRSDLVDATLKEEISAQVSPHMYKLLDFGHHPKRNLLLGDSRSNTLSYALDPSRWANMTYGGGSLKEMTETFWWVAEKYELDTVLIGINLNLYNKNNRRFYVEQAIETLQNYISYSFNKNVFRSSFLILKSNMSKEEVSLNKTTLTKEAFWEEHLRTFPEKFYSRLVYPEEYHSSLVRIAEYCDQNDIALTFWIPPTHVEMQHVIKQYNVDEMDARFKRDLRSLGEVYDYNYPHSITEDKENFSDPVHFTYDIAVRIRDEIFRGKQYFAKYTARVAGPFSATAQTDPNPILPDTLYLALGNRLELWNDDVAFIPLGNTRYSFDWEYEVGKSDSRKWYWTSDAAGTFPLRFNCYLDGILVDEAHTMLVVEEKVSGKTYSMLTLGNSLTTTGFDYQMEQIMQDLDTSIEPIGTQGNTYKHEAYGGWGLYSYHFPESPFYFDGNFDPARYISENGLKAPDIVRISLGTNDCLLSNPMGSINDQASELVHALLEAFPEAVLFIAMPTLCENTGDGWVVSYGSLDNYERYQLRVRELWEYLLDTYGPGTGSERVYVSYDGLLIDRDRGYFKDENGHNNGLHPRDIGQRQLVRGFSNVLNHCLLVRTM